MGIWVHIHTITTTNVAPEVLGDVSVQMMPHGFG
jgi:hypothetical protein